jgi:hypothetical protein
MRHALVGIFALVLLALGCDGEDESEAETVAKQCVRVRDHLIKLRLETVAAQPVAAQAKRSPKVEQSIREQHRAALASSLGEDFADRCAQTMTATQIDCVLDSRDSDAAGACTR